MRVITTEGIAWPAFKVLRFASTVIALLLVPIFVAAQEPSLRTWYESLSHADQRVVNVVVIGDSIACCIGPKEYKNVWTNLLRVDAESEYRSHGSGVIPVGNNDGISMNPQWTLNLSEGKLTTIDFGPFQHGKGSFGSVFRLSGKARLTVSAHGGDHAVIYFATASDSQGGIKVFSGNVVLGVIGKVRSSSIEARTASIRIPVDRREHTISLEPADSTSSVYIYGVEFTVGTTGLSVHNVAHGYARSEAWGGNPSSQLSFLKMISGNIDLAIIALGVNDSINGTGTTGEEYARNIENIVNELRAMNPSMVIMIQDENNTVPGETAKLLSQRSIRAIEEDVARKMDLEFVSIASDWGSERQSASKGYMARDGVHPSDLGDRRIAKIMESILLEGSNLPSRERSTQLSSVSLGARQKGLPNERFGRLRSTSYSRDASF